MMMMFCGLDGWMRHEESRVKRHFIYRGSSIWNHVLWGPPWNDSSSLIFLIYFVYCFFSWITILFIGLNKINHLILWNGCIGLFLIGENGFETRKIIRFCKLYIKHQDPTKKSFPNSEIIHLLRTHNLMVDSITRNVRNQTSFIVYMYAKLPVWFT